jgi:DNA ligase-associated metallophosphoesterase
MQDFLIHELEGERLFLLPERALWWPEKKALIVADVHLGKATHLNKAGMSLPNKRASRDIAILSILVKELEAEKVIILGDLFHSDYNSEFKLLEDFCAAIAPAKAELVIGNHDIAGAQRFVEAGLIVREDPYCIAPFCFTHDAAGLSHKHDYFILSGHVHPGVKLHGKAKQSISLPCFYFGATYGLLPAFGTLTGLQLIQQTDPAEVIFGIAGEKVVRIPSLFKSEV